MINIGRGDLAITSDYCLIQIACPILCGVFVCLRFENRKKAEESRTIWRRIFNRFLYLSYWSPFRSLGFHKQWDSLLALLPDQAPLFRIKWVHLFNIPYSRTILSWSLPFCICKRFLKPVKIILSCIWLFCHFVTSRIRRVTRISQAQCYFLLDLYLLCAFVGFTRVRLA